VHPREVDGVGVGVGDRGVRDQSHAGRPRGVDNRAVLGDAQVVWSVGRDEQQLVGAGERGGQGVGAVVVRLPDLHTAAGEVGCLLRAAHRHRDLPGGHTQLDQVFHRVAAELPGGSGYNDHDDSFARPVPRDPRCGTL